TLGTVRLELIAAGAGLGSASLVADVNESRVLYAGRLGRHDGLGGPRDARPCQTLVLGVPRGDDVRFAEHGDLVAWVIDHLARARAAGGAVVLVVGGPLDVVEVAARLGDHVGRGPALTRALVPLVTRA